MAFAEFSALGSLLRPSEVPDSLPLPALELRHVDVHEHPSLARQMDIASFPTIILYHAGHAIEYTDERDAQSMWKWLQTVVDIPPALPLATPDALEVLLAQCHGKGGFHSSGQCDGIRASVGIAACLPEASQQWNWTVRAAARGLAPYGIVFGRFVGPSAATCQGLGAPPLFIAVRESAVTRADGSGFVEKLLSRPGELSTLTDLWGWALAALEEDVPEVSPELYDYISRTALAAPTWTAADTSKDGPASSPIPSLGIVWLFCDSSPASVEYLLMAKSIASGSLYPFWFVHAPAAVYQGVACELGLCVPARTASEHAANIGTADASLRVPSFAVERLVDGTHYALLLAEGANLTETELCAWLDDVIRDVIPPTLRSVPVVRSAGSPVEGSEDVLVPISGDDFNATVLGSGLNVVVLVTASWCSFCQPAASALQLAVNAFRATGCVIGAVIDGAINDIPPSYISPRRLAASGYPTIFLVPAEDPATRSLPPMFYDGHMDAESLASFIAVSAVAVNQCVMKEPSRQDTVPGSPFERQGLLTFDPLELSPNLGYGDAAPTSTHAAPSWSREAALVRRQAELEQEMQDLRLSLATLARKLEEVNPP